MAKVGRPSEYTPEAAEAICARLATGESLAAICRDDAMPAASTVYVWLRAQAAFAESYARARNVGLDLLADEVIEIADDRGGNTDRDRLRVDARKWYLAKLAAKKYGDRVAHEIEGSGGGPVRLEHGIDTDPDRLAALSKLLGEISGDGS